MSFFNNYIVVILVRTSVQANNKNNQEYEAVMARHGVLQTFPVHQVVKKHNLLTRLFKNIACSPGCEQSCSKILWLDMFIVVQRTREQPPIFRCPPSSISTTDHKAQTQ